MGFKIYSFLISPSPPETSGFREGAGESGRPLPLRDSAHCQPKGSPFLYYFEISTFGWLTLEFFWRHLGRQNILNLRASARRKNAIFCKSFPKSAPKRNFFGKLFHNFDCGAENVAETRSFQFYDRARKINLIDLKKVRLKLEWFLSRINSPLMRCRTKYSALFFKADIWW